MEITGRVTADAKVRSLSETKQVVSFSVAVNDSYKAKNGERVTQTEFFDCSYWIGTGIPQYLTKGTVVELSGRVSARAWVDSEGQAKAGLNFHTSKITLHGGGLLRVLPLRRRRIAARQRMPQRQKYTRR